MTSNITNLNASPPAPLTIRMGGFFAQETLEYGSAYYHLYLDIPGFAGGIGNSEDEMGAVYTITLYRDEAELRRTWAGYTAFARLARLHGELDDGDADEDDFPLTPAEAATICEPNCALCIQRIGLPACYELLTYEDSDMRERARYFFATVTKEGKHHA